ncbi:putative oligoendopeptidase F [Monocercomonoides exilis]|uniref:putative oligoendopeptidase F n=1 Tax=Monocercomonoides exilis TaxID=2049356 RepID=UPI00355A31E2|nr:putative oligoendopeptidase F [Monocercomonoides exilis]
MSENSSSVKMVPLRSEIDDKYKWDSFFVYPSHKAWKEDFDTLDSMIKPIEEFKGHLHEGPEKVVEVFRLDEQLDLKLHYLEVHMNLAVFEDRGDSEAQGMESMFNTKKADLSSKLSWVRPEILALPDETLNKYHEYSGMKEWMRAFEEIVRYKPHSLSAKEEELLSAAAPALDASSQTFTMLSDADLTFPVIENESGEKIELTSDNYISFLESSDREVRKRAFDATYSTHIAKINTVCSLFDGQAKKEIFLSKARKFPSCVEHALFGDNIPLSVYTSLIEAMHQSLPSFHRYLSMRQRVMKLPSLDMYDLYVPLVKDYKLKIPYEQAVEWSLEALKPLGEEYCEVARKALIGGDKWADVYQTKGKRGGACSFSMFKGKQFMMMNYMDNLDSVFTLIHELGHSMHSHYSSLSQPFRTFEYSLAVAEIASTLNEALLAHYLLEKARKEGNKEMEIYLLNQKCETFKGTIIRQVQFAEFDLRFHEMAEKGEPLTPDSLAKLYKDINDVYYGDQCLVKDGKPEFPHVLKADPRIAYEFVRVPHFFFNFYVYKYATSMCVSEAIANRILKGSKEDLEKYFRFLRAGSSKDPLEIIEDAGIDLRTPQPYVEAMEGFKFYLDELEKMLAV